MTVFSESCCGFLLQQCLNGTWCLTPIPGSHTDPFFCHLLTVPSDRPNAPTTAPAPPGHLSSATHHDDHVHLTGAPELPPGLRGCHQPQDQPGALCFLCVPVHVLLLWQRWWGFEELCQVFSSPISWGEGIYWETDEAEQPIRWSNLRISRNQTVMTRRMGWMQWQCALHLESVTTGLTQTGHWKRPSFVWLHWDSLPGWAGEIHQRIGWPHKQLVHVGGSWVCHGRASLWQAHPGRQWGELSLRLPSHGHRGDFPVTRVVHACRSDLYLFCNLYQIIHLCPPFLPFLQIKVIWYPLGKKLHKIHS